MALMIHKFLFCLTLTIEWHYSLQILNRKYLWKASMLPSQTQVLTWEQGRLYTGDFLKLAFSLSRDSGQQCVPVFMEADGWGWPALFVINSHQIDELWYYEAKMWNSISSENCVSPEEKSFLNWLQSTFLVNPNLIWLLLSLPREWFAPSVKTLVKAGHDGTCL